MGHIVEFIRAKIESSRKKGFVIGVSGGLDSSVCLYLVHKAVGSGRTHPVFMPHRPAHGELKKTIGAMCTALGLTMVEYDLGRIIAEFVKETNCSNAVLTGNFAARIRMSFLYHHAAANDLLVVGTGNMTEKMTGYTTKWGDQAGDICPIGGLYKSQVYELAEELGIPESVINVVPSAGFYEGQEDEKELGISYAELDAILRAIAAGSEKELDQNKVNRVKELIEASAHKRRFPESPALKV
ncbi:MAG: NAD+ synthase [Elusimicrobiota bacterium]